MLQKLLISLLLIFILGNFAWAQTPVHPPENPERTMRIGYLEGGEFPDYQTIFLRTVEGLIHLGWIEPMKLPENYDANHRRVWEWVADNATSDYIEFVKDAFYSSGFDADRRGQTQQALLNRLQETKDIDLMLAMGTWAGQDLANNSHDVPTVVASTSDPLGSGIIQSMDDSGFDHLHAKVEPDRYKRQMQLFHDIIGFKSMGLVYENSAEGRTFAAVSDAEHLAEERGFKLKTCFAQNNNVTQEQASSEVLECYTKLSPQVEAFYITTHRGERLENLPRLLDPLFKHQVATFAMPGSQFVKHGVLLSIAHADFAHVGRFHAETIAKIFNGAIPRDIEQKWTAPPKIAVNLRTSEIIGFNPPFDVLAAADEMYEQIIPVKEK